MGKIIEGKDIHASQTVKTKVCIIGSGCGGAALGKKLQEAGLDTVIIEQGGYENPRTFDNFELNMSGRVTAERNLDTDAGFGVNLTYGKNLGGASVHYWADSYRTPEDRLELWANKYAVEGHGVSDLKHIWPVLDKTLNVHPAGDDMYNNMNRLFEKGARAMGWKGHQVPQARKNCQHSGHCMQGCFFDAKQSQLVTHLPQFLKAGGNVYTDLRADQLFFKGDRIEALEARVLDKRKQQDSSLTIRIEADTFVVAAGGFNSSAFLLKNDLGKKLPALGRHFIMNPSVFSHALFEEDVVQWRNIPAAYGVHHFRLPTYEGKVYKEGGYLLMPNQLQPGMLSATLPGIGADHREWMSQLRKVGGTIGWLDDHPDELGHIEISGGVRKVHYPIGPRTAAMMRDLLKKQVQLSFAAGAKKVTLGSLKPIILKSMDDIKIIDSLPVEKPGFLMQAAPHPAGGCRMGKDPKRSVTNSKHQVHGLQNLYVSDSSVFPTGPSVDPSYTIMAFSYRLAEMLG